MDYTFSMSSICAPSGHSTQHTCRPLFEQLLEDAGAVALQFGDRTGVIIGLDRDVFDPDTLLVLLCLDDRRDIELQPGQVELTAAPGDLPLHGRAEIVDIEFRDFLGSSLVLIWT